METFSRQIADEYEDNYVLVLTINIHFSIIGGVSISIQYRTMGFY